jgi:hypothetical protein
MFEFIKAKWSASLVHSAAKCFPDEIKDHHHTKERKIVCTSAYIESLSAYEAVFLIFPPAASRILSMYKATQAAQTLYWTSTAWPTTLLFKGISHIWWSAASAFRKVRRAGPQHLPTTSLLETLLPYRRVVAVFAIFLVCSTGSRGQQKVGAVHTYSSEVPANSTKIDSMG